VTQIYLCRENQFLAAHCSESHHLKQYAETGKASLETIFNCGNFICKYYWMFLIFSGCFQQRYTNYSITSKHFESFVFFMGYKYEPLLMERFSTHCCLIPVFSTPRNTYGCRADEPNHFVYVSWFVSIVKWKRKWNWSHQHFYSQRYNQPKCRV
jgi:hypothetical protein